MGRGVGRTRLGDTPPSASTSALMIDHAQAPAALALDEHEGLRHEELALLERAKAGDERALRDIYEAHQSQVRGHLHRMLGSDPEIDDLVQTVFARAFAAIEGFEGKAAISTWLYRITANTTHNLLRQRFRRARMQRALRWFDAGREADLVQASKVVARDEVQRILEQLHPDLREVFVLYHYEGLTLQEIAEILDRPLSTIGDRLTRARKRLQSLVDEVP